MSYVFVGGSRRIVQLAQPITHRLDNIINSNFTVLVGDASGVDLQVQKYLFSKNYKNVIVFCTGNVCRNNVGKWKTRNVVTEMRSKGFHFYAVKDLQMAKEATYGFMIWDAKSKGTLNNMLNLLHRKKKILVYFAPTQSFQTVRTTDDLRTLLALCDQQDVEIFEKELTLQQFFKTVQAQLDFNTLENRDDSEKVVMV